MSQTRILKYVLFTWFLIGLAHNYDYEAYFLAYDKGFQMSFLCLGLIPDLCFTKISYSG